MRSSSSRGVLRRSPPDPPRRFTGVNPVPRRTSAGAWVRYYLGRILQVTGLLVTLLAATAYFGTPSTTAMLRQMLVGVLLFVPGYWLARKDPRA